MEKTVGVVEIRDVVEQIAARRHADRPIAGCRRYGVNVVQDVGLEYAVHAVRITDNHHRVVLAIGVDDAGAVDQAVAAGDHLQPAVDLPHDIGRRRGYVRDVDRRHGGRRISVVYAVHIFTGQQGSGRRAAIRQSRVVSVNQGFGVEVGFEKNRPVGLDRLQPLESARQIRDPPEPSYGRSGRLESAPLSWAAWLSGSTLTSSFATSLFTCSMAVRS